MHRYLLDYDGSKVVDHINNNTLDCRKENLRIASISKNNSNVKFSTNTDVKGIERISVNKYIASKRFHGIAFSKSVNSMAQAVKAMEGIDMLIKFYINNYDETSIK